MSSMDNNARSTNGSPENTKSNDPKLALPKIPEDQNYSIKRYEEERFNNLINCNPDYKAAKKQSALAIQECLTKLDETGSQSQGGPQISKYKYPQKLQLSSRQRSITPPTTDGEHRLPKA